MALEMDGQSFPRIGTDILNLGSRRGYNTKSHDNPRDHITALTLGRPGQFDVPNVPNVRLFSLSPPLSFWWCADLLGVFFCV